MILLISCQSQKIYSIFTFEKNKQGVKVMENRQPIFFYQRMTKSLNGKYLCNNYLHPLYSLNGDTLTEEFPADHLYHRGIFWAWHQVYINGKSVGDSWIMENIEQKVVKVQTLIKRNTAQLKLNVFWKSPLFENSRPFISENTSITVYPLKDSIRKIDFTISLKALTSDVEIGGSDDEKGYGGLCARLKLPDNLIFTSLNGDVMPQLGQIEAGPWMDFSASFARNRRTTDGLSIFCHPQTPNYPAPWILRSETSMQNIVFPGRNRIVLPINKPVTLFYRLIIHNGNAKNINLVKLQKEYEGTSVAN